MIEKSNSLYLFDNFCIFLCRLVPWEMVLRQHRFKQIKKRSAHYTWSKISGDFTVEETTVNVIPAYQLTSNLSTPGVVTRGEVSVQYSDEFNTHETKYDTLIKFNRSSSQFVDIYFD